MWLKKSTLWMCSPGSSSTPRPRPGPSPRWPWPRRTRAPPSCLAIPEKWSLLENFFLQTIDHFFWQEQWSGWNKVKMLTLLSINHPPWSLTHWDQALNDRICVYFTEVCVVITCSVYPSFICSFSKVWCFLINTPRPQVETGLIKLTAGLYKV